MAEEYRESVARYEKVKAEWAPEVKDVEQYREEEIATRKTGIDPGGAERKKRQRSSERNVQAAIDTLQEDVKEGRVSEEEALRDVAFERAPDVPAAVKPSAAPGASAVVRAPMLSKSGDPYPYLAGGGAPPAVPVEPVVEGLPPVVDGIARKLILLGIASAVFKALAKD